MKHPIKGKVSISRRSSMKGSGSIHIQLEDDSSGVTIAEFEMTYADFAECVTGMSASNAMIHFLPTHTSIDRYGKKRITKTVFCDKVKTTYGKYKEAQRKAVMDHFEANYADDGWNLFGDGTTSQQHDKQHHYTINRFE